MVKRWIENDVESAMAVRRGVFLTGARQSGKTTLATMLKLANAKKLTLDNAGVRVAAQTDPITFVERKAGQTMVIDEVQKAPGLLGVEVKAGALVGEDDFKHMKWFAKNLAKTPFTGIVLYAGKDNPAVWQGISCRADIVPRLTSTQFANVMPLARGVTISFCEANFSWWI